MRELREVRLEERVDVALEAGRGMEEDEEEEDELALASLMRRDERAERSGPTAVQ